MCAEEIYWQVCVTVISVVHDTVSTCQQGCSFLSVVLPTPKAPMSRDLSLTGVETVTLGYKVKKMVCVRVVPVVLFTASSEQVTSILNVLGLKKHNLSKFWKENLILRTQIWLQNFSWV